MANPQDTEKIVAENTQALIDAMKKGAAALRDAGISFALAGGLAGVGGLLFLLQFNMRYDTGFQLGLIAFTAAVMGGIGNLQGAVLGGLIIGCIQQISDNRIGGEWTPAIVFAYLVLIMVFKPQGLIGEQTREAG